MLAVLALLLALPMGGWWWASRDGSLQQALRMAQGVLPPGQSLQFSDVQGSITGGGRIGRLQWSAPDFALEIDDLQLEWSLRQLLGRALHLRKLQAARVHLRLTPRPDAPESPPFSMPGDISLPIEVAVPLAVARLHIETIGADGVAVERVIQDINARYHYDGTHHSLQLHSLHFGQSYAQADLRLHARDLTLQGQVGAALRDLVADVPHTMLLRLQAEGTLAGGEAARIELRLDASEPTRQEPLPEPANLLAQLADLSTTLEAGTTTELAQRARAEAEATVHPWRSQPLEQVRFQLAAIDLRAFIGSAPATVLHGQGSLSPAAGPEADGWDLDVDLRNAQPGPLDRERLPVDRLLADLRIGTRSWRAETLEVYSGSGRLVAQGQYGPGEQTVDVRADLRELPLKGIHSRLANAPSAQLSGAMRMSGNLRQGLSFNADLRTDAAAAGVGAESRSEWEIRSLQLDGDWTPTSLRIARLHVDAFQATIDGSDIDIVLPGFDAIQARVVAAAPGVSLDADAAMRQQSGGGKLAVQLESAAQTVAWLQELPVIGDRLPALQGSGSAALQAEWQGGWRQWLEGFSQPARHPQLRLEVNAAAEALHIELPADTANRPPLQLGADRLELLLEGNLAAATLVVDGDLRVNATRGTLNTRMQMTRDGGAGPPAWNFSVQQLVAAANLPDQQQPWRLELAEGLQLTVVAGTAVELRTTAGKASLFAPPGSGAHDVALEVDWQPLLWRRSADGTLRLQSSGAIRGIQPEWLDALRAPDDIGPLAEAGLYTDLLLSAEWDVQMTDQLAIRAQLSRDSGDIWLLGSAPGGGDGDPGGGSPVGLRTFEAGVQSSGGQVALALDLDSERAGNASARLSTELVQRAGGWRLPQSAPLAGNVQVQLQELGVWGLLAPPGWRVSGAMNADITLAGTVQDPELRGTVEGSGLQIRSVLDGIDLHDGTLRATLDGQQLQLTELALQGGTGSRAYISGISGNRTQPASARGRMIVTGSIDWSGVATAAPGQTGISMDLSASLERMQALVRNDRQLTLSGELSAGLQQGALRVRGDLRVDRGTILLPDAGAPTLGDDVVVVRDADDTAALADRNARGQLQTALPLDLEVELDLGRDLAVQGMGLSTRLEGELIVRSSSGGRDSFSVFGEVRTDDGRYRAWGQAMNIESGIVRFNGSYLNPSLNLLAIRPEIEVRAGVRVTGTLSAPVVQLYSDPSLPESEILSWVVLGRPSVISGAEGSSMQQAALSLLAGRLASSFADDIGVDELGVNESAFSIGKRISNELYVTYEAGLSGAASVLYVFYDITRRLTLRAQTGEASAVDLIYTINYD
ncbi:MAG TPA: translocation/assembly module TamB domain-containing protein [Steroidobacteraceae bacterium]|nr:translocation/assembly module TamB domain-containing protein [Steroidobacteraceae bacterium]